MLFLMANHGSSRVKSEHELIVNTSGTVVVEYTYDAWGRLLTTTGSMASTLGEINPLRYRGYVYDSETGLYYLQSRYYNPAIGRFINADEYVGTGQGTLGYNMYAYCLSNPVRYVDYCGRFSGSPPVIGPGLTLPEGGGWEINIDGTVYYYTVSYNGNGELYEYWFDANGDLVWIRHHSTHGNGKHHEDPHDHRGGKDKDGKNTIGKKEKRDDKFRPPEQFAGAPQGATSIWLKSIGVGIALFATYEIVKWGTAAAFAPITGGISFVIAGAAP